MSNSLLKSEWEVLREQLKSEKAVLKALEEHYEAALVDIETRIASMLGRQDANLPHVIRRIEYQQMVKAQVQAALDKLHANEYETISEYLNESYTDAFVGSVYTLHQQGVPLILPIDQSVVAKAVTIDSKLKTDLYRELGVDVNHLKKSIASEITRGIASNMMYSDIARNIRFAAKIPKGRAQTIARTEAGRVQEQATFDAAKEAVSHGADVVKQWSAILDGKTRDSHRVLDGQIREVDKPFEVNGHKAMHPHGFGVAAEDIGCRCITLIRARSALDEGELKTLRERAVRHSLYMDDPKTYRADKLPKLKNFEEFKKSYLKAAKTLENTGESGIMIVGKHYVSGKGFTIHQDKILKFCLKPGAKHFQEFYDVGYRNRPGYMVDEAKLLVYDINNGYDESKATERFMNQNGAEKFSIFMNLGFGGGKRFRTVWQKDTPDSKPRLITAHREDLK